MQAMLDQITQTVGAYLPNLVGALGILVVGWLLAIILAAIVKGVLRRTGLGERLAGVFGKGEGEGGVDVAGGVGKAVYYFILLFVLVAFFQALGITLITEPINRLLTRIFEFAPRIMGAAVLFLIAWVLATVLRMGLSKVLQASRIDERLGGQAGTGEEAEETTSLPISKSLADVVYWLVFLLFLPAILSALALEGILDPVRGMIDKLLGYFPNLLAAAVILLVGWFVARIVRRLVSGLLGAVGLDRLGERVGLSKAVGKQQLSGLVGTVVYFLILVPILIASLNALSLESISRPASDMLNAILSALPKLFGAALVLVLSYIVGRVVSDLVVTLLAGIGFDSVLVKVGLGKEPAEGKKAPSSVVGSLIIAAIMLFALIEAFGILGFASLEVLASQFLVFASHVIFGLVIFAIGLYLANLVARTIQSSGSAHAGSLAMGARVSILVLSGAMALRRMGLANEIVNVAFGLLLGAVAVAVAIAFGLGGKEAAARKLEEWQKSNKSPNP